MTAIYPFLLIFCVASLLGWILEVLYALVTKKKLINRGFLFGPYLPIFGFGIVLLYILFSLNINIFLKILFGGFLVTLIELFTGLFFINFYNLRLWDYSNEFLNFKGIICLKYSIYWILLISLLYRFLLRPLNLLINFSSNSWSIFILLELFYVTITIDFFNSLGIAQRIKKQVNLFNQKNLIQLKLNYEIFRQNSLNYIKRLKQVNFFEKRLFLISHFKNKDFRKMFNAFLEKNKAALIKHKKRIKL